MTELKDTETNTDTDEQKAHAARLLQNAEAGDVLPVSETDTEAAAVVAPVSLEAELAGLVKIAIQVLAPAMPNLASLYTDETTNTACAAIASVCNKHGWLQGGLMGGYSVEISAAFVLVPLAFSTRQAVMLDIETARNKLNKNKTETPADNKYEAGLDLTKAA